MSHLQSLKPWKDLRVLFCKTKSRMQPVSNLNLFLHAVRNTVTSSFDLPWETDEWSRLLTMLFKGSVRKDRPERCSGFGQSSWYTLCTRFEWLRLRHNGSVRQMSGHAF